LGNFSSLLFELSSDDRLDILMLLKKKPLRLSHISRDLDFTVQETSRNMMRLTDSKLIMKDVNGNYHLTPYGDEALNLLSGFKFIFKNREYLTTHILDCLPETFSLGLGVLERFELVDDVMVAFHNVEDMIANAEKFVWILTNQVLVSTLPFLMQAIERSVEFRLLMPKNFVPPEGLRELIDVPVFSKASQSKCLETRFSESVDVFLCLSEKQVAVIGFPNLNGKFDYFGFKAKNVVSVEWAMELFDYYWQKASSHVPDQLLNA